MSEDDVSSKQLLPKQMMLIKLGNHVIEYACKNNWFQYICCVLI